MQKVPALLKVMSILSIILGALGCLAGIVLLAGSLMLGAAAGAATGSTVAGVAVGGLLVLVTVIACVNGILMLLAGISGVRCRLNSAWKLGIAVLVLAAIGFVCAIIGGTFSVSTVLNLAIPVLFLVGVKQAREM